MTEPLTAGPAAVCRGVVVHHRHRPVDHRFCYAVNYVWLDPDRPGDLVDRHPLWSIRWPAAVRFHRPDYLDGTDRPLGDAVRAVAEPATTRPVRTIRMLTQPRTWGWLFNPITLYFLWSGAADEAPMAAVLEVTNTPWKERHLYPIALEPDDRAEAVRSRFDKVLHVSPFLDEAHRYDLRLARSVGPNGTDRLTVDLDVTDVADPVTEKRIQTGDDDEESGYSDDRPATGPVLTTRLTVDRQPAERSVMTSYLLQNPLPTHRVSAAIHAQAWRLWRRGVPVVAHPRRRGRR